MRLYIMTTNKKKKIYIWLRNSNLIGSTNIDHRDNLSWDINFHCKNGCCLRCVCHSGWYWLTKFHRFCIWFEKKTKGIARRFFISSRDIEKKVTLNRDLSTLLLDTTSRSNRTPHCTFWYFFFSRECSEKITSRFYYNTIQKTPSVCSLLQGDRK